MFYICMFLSVCRALFNANHSYSTQAGLKPEYVQYGLLAWMSKCSHQTIFLLTYRQDLISCYATNLLKV